MAFSPQILIVDDEPSILELLRVGFVRAGFEVVTANGPVAAMDACRARTFDVVLTDVRMPQMDGHELARWVAVNQPSVRTVLMSGYDLECEQCPYSPRCLLLNKPLRSDEAVDAVKQMLKHPE